MTTAILVSLLTAVAVVAMMGWLAARRRRSLLDREDADHRSLSNV